MTRPRLARLASRAPALSVSSARRGTSPNRTAPTTGTKIAPVSAQWSKNSIVLLAGCQDEDEAEKAGGAEQHSRVLLHTAGLDVAEEAAALLGREARTVHDAVDHLLIDDVVHEAGHLAADERHAVHDAVDDVLVEPVHGPGDRVLDRADDAVDVDLVEEVLLLEEAVPGPGRAAPAREAVRPEVAEVVAEVDADADEGYGGRQGRQRHREGELVDDLAGHALDLEGHPAGEAVEPEGAEPPGADRADGQDAEGPGHRRRRLVGMSLTAVLAPEDEVAGARHVGRRHEGADEPDGQEDGVLAPLSAEQDLVLGPEPGEGKDAGQGSRPHEEGPEGRRHALPEPAHVAHVVGVHGVDQRP